MNRPALVVLTLCVSTPVFAGSYEMKDLEALEKQSAWQEAIQHLGDIPPSKRNGTWDRIAEKSAAGVLEAIDPSKEGGGRDYYGGSSVALPNGLSTADAIAKQYPSLLKSKVFMQARADAALKGFAVTYQNSSHNASDDPWRDQLKAFVATDTMTPDLQLRVGKLITSRLVAYIAIPYFKQALAKNGGLCKDADVKASIVSSIAYAEWTDDGKAMGEKCWNDVRPGLEAEVKKKHADDAKKNACPVLAAHKVNPAECKPE